MRTTSGTRSRTARLLRGIACAAAAGCAGQASFAGAAAIERVSVSSAGRQGDRPSFGAGISASGRYVVFSSEATNLVPADTNDRRDVFVRDRVTGKTTRVSVSSTGAEAAPGADPFGGSSAGGISADGRYVVFSSDAPNLVPGDTNRVADVFVHDRATGRTSRVSVGPRGRQANGPSRFPSLSANGRYVVFDSAASNLVAGDGNRAEDVFLRDLRAGRTLLVSVGPRGRHGNDWSEGPVIGADGRTVAFTSAATNLVRGDTNRLPDVFVRDLRARTTSRVSVRSGGGEGRGKRFSNGSNAPSVSASGRFVAFHSDLTNLVPHDTNGAFDIFVHDRRTGATRRVSVGPDGRQANAESLGPECISADGRYVAFTSLASNLVAGDANDMTDTFVHDRRTGRTVLASRAAGGGQGSDASAVGIATGGGRAFTADGRFLLLSSWAPELVPGDTNGVADVFVRELPLP